MVKICCLHFRDCVRPWEAKLSELLLPGTTSPSPNLGPEERRGRGGKKEVVLMAPACSLRRVCF
jgi:hypothetical protein